MYSLRAGIPVESRRCPLTGLRDHHRLFESHRSPILHHGGLGSPAQTLAGAYKPAPAGSCVQGIPVETHRGLVTERSGQFGVLGTCRSPGILFGKLGNPAQTLYWHGWGRNPHFLKQDGRSWRQQQSGSHLDWPECCGPGERCGPAGGLWPSLFADPSPGQGEHS